MPSMTDYANMVKELLKAEEGLTPWEVNFIESLKDHKWFSQKQAETIEKIWNKIYG